MARHELDCFLGLILIIFDFTFNFFTECQSERLSLLPGAHLIVTRLKKQLLLVLILRKQRGWQLINTLPLLLHLAQLVIIGLGALTRAHWVIGLIPLSIQGLGIVFELQLCCQAFALAAIVYEQYRIWMDHILQCYSSLPKLWSFQLAHWRSYRGYWYLHRIVVLNLWIILSNNVLDHFAFSDYWLLNLIYFWSTILRCVEWINLGCA